VVAAALVALQAGCMSMAAFQTGRTLPKGDYQYAIGGGSFAGGDGNSAFFLEGVARYGLFENVDIGARFALPGWTGIDAKYQVFANDKFALAAGMALGGIEMEMSFGDAGKAKVTIFDVVVPVYASYNVGPALALYAVPKFVARFMSGDVSQTSEQLVGGTGGIKLGDGSGLYLEATYMQRLQAGQGDMQYDVAYFWSW